MGQKLGKKKAPFWWGFFEVSSAILVVFSVRLDKLNREGLRRDAPSLQKGSSTIRTSFVLPVIIPPFAKPPLPAQTTRAGCRCFEILRRLFLSAFANCF
jgi:hypothetical protein